MDFTALRYFSATAHARSIRAASDRLHVSPSAISRQIAKLEHELRAPIFDRRAQGMKLTPAGEILLSKIDGVMREFSRVKSHIAALADLQAGNVDVYCFQTAIESFVAPVLNRFHTQYPDVTFNVRMSSTDEAMEALVAGTAEIGLILNPPVRETITRLEVFRDRMVAAFSPVHPLAGRKLLSLRELEGFPFVLTEPSFGLRQQLERVFVKHRFEPATFCVTNSLALVKEVASIGNHCTLLPRFAVEKELAAGHIKAAAVREFASDPLIFCICSATDRSLSPAAQVFMNIVMDYCRRYRH
ncbi:LysR family transcriptional regulator [Bradyrhizobium sp. ARR65]|uniref:LysR family transcriptional regulator n=1 Tax=Bradyrhizobium sp. ARR65 TaxID=1040989 RepID=UPI00055085AB|nr:LysR family transcriptional regulator [Bradyrhizobium sp. ARR65]